MPALVNTRILGRRIYFAVIFYAVRGFCPNEKIKSGLDLLFVQQSHDNKKQGGHPPGVEPPDQ